ncbi:INO80 chromatin remodeling complex Ies1 [Colletotrichum higginsianum]|uniref:INO80 chromatin remodeling complex Ies1 n=3 Tax=Colletotrichum destructivum species complex TaxID=2707350 RepID=H1V9X3_COLHI|nr:INO80 chromatin remodeling complex Ies1 [Colletotrichum higginsianum IMI 349063]OBR11849.1 INO80 chromatin remodeling complex Ies1 [Colletotrichum higginsianum IMI 349063]TIC99819.1 Ino eighty subunit 1 [Colletotrichum higginsianum]CCF37026.1 INO80 chromatin remodeling complex Ies1 [Colletotrichum higginsianum]
MSPDSPSSPAGNAVSDAEAPTSPVRGDEGKSFLSQAMTEDDDTRMMDGTPEPTEKTSGRGKGKNAAKESSSNITGKIRHLKKEDGEPLWRKDIQYDFLKAIFDDETAVFTNSYEPERPRQNFADLYIDTMSRSSKTSKVLRDKLLSDRSAAKGMAMVCLLVNIGRMNTTLNFFPEMRAQLRTYHAIPSLQAHQDAHAYKQLQDAPRLKSILKGGAEDREEPGSLNKIKARDVPRTNPVNLLFVICQSAAKIAELHFPPGREFHDLVMKTNYTSISRAKAFLWIMWFYLESDFTEEGCDENPFGPGVDYGVDVANQGVPELIEMTTEDEAAENVDTEVEIKFGEEKQKMRAKILEADQAYLADNQTKRGSRTSRVMAEDGPAILPRIRPSKHESDMDSVRSTPPPKALARGLGGSVRRGGAPLKYQIFEASSPAGPAHGSAEGIVARKPRPPTAHQIAVERNRNQRVEYILDRGYRKELHKAKKKRQQGSTLYRAFMRIKQIDNPFEDSDPEDDPRQQLSNNDGNSGPFRQKGLGGIAPLASENDDFGEEANAYTAALRRTSRRLKRWGAHEGPPLGVIPPRKRKKANGETNGNDEAGDMTMDLDTLRASEARDGSQARANGDVNGDETLGDITMGDITMDDGDDADKTAAADDDEELDEMDRSLLGLAAEDSASEDE